MTIPHHFPSLVEGPAQVVLIVGTGFSTPDAPTVKDLEASLTKVGTGLGVTVKQKDDAYFYVLAEAILKKLTDDDGRAEPESRLWLATQLGMLDDRHWFGEIGFPLSGNTPRHRAIARFAVEERLRAIISLNWDALLEAALESVGLPEGLGAPRPWRVTSYARIVDVSDKPRLADPSVFPVIKPHGCVRNLERARRKFANSGVVPPFIFKLTKSELNNLPKEQRTLVDETVSTYISENPLLAVGWKASENYLRDAVVRIAKSVNRRECDAFTLVNRSWYPSAKKPESHHDEIATAYGMNEAKCFVSVSKSGRPTPDQLFQWLQARYALNRLIAAASGLQQGKLSALLAQLGELDWNNPIISWVDNWLPAWVRLCWRTGVMQGDDIRTGRKIEACDIPVMPRDVHVPLGGMSLKRLDLQAAAHCLVEISPILRRFDYVKFPGALWDTESHNLYLPLPAWRGSSKSADLAALKPFVDAIHSWGFVRKLQLVRIDVEDAPPDDIFLRQLAAQVQRLMPRIGLAKKDAISLITFDEIKGGLNAPVA